MPKVSATMEGKTPKRMPYARPERPETRTRRLGLEILRPHAWAMKKMTPETKRHHTRLAWRRLTRKSEPIPEGVSGGW